jgi:hypothetical protein
MEITDKLQLKPGHRVTVIGLPSDVDLRLSSSAQADASSADAVIVFVSSDAELSRHRQVLVSAARRDALAWVAYPKAGALGTDLNRDTLAARLITEGIHPVRQIAIDAVWSALRLRPGG